MTTEDNGFRIAATDVDRAVHGLGGDPKGTTYRVDHVDERMTRIVPDRNGSAVLDEDGHVVGTNLKPGTAYRVFDDGDGLTLMELEGHEADVRIVTNDRFWDKATRDWDEAAESMKL